MSYEEVLLKTDPGKAGTVKRGTPEEREAIDRFIDFFAILSKENIQEKIRSVYADTAWLNDNLKEVSGIEEIEAYLVSGAEGTESVTVKMTDVAESNGNYYFRWVMDIKFKKLKRGKVTRSIGMSHIRFDRDGKIVMHQDYWDSARGFFDHVPVISGMLKLIRRRL